MKPVLWDVQTPSEPHPHPVLAETAFGACAKRGLLMSEAVATRARMAPEQTPELLEAERARVAEGNRRERERKSLRG